MSKSHKKPARFLLTLFVAAVQSAVCSCIAQRALAADGAEPRFSAPTNAEELAARIEALRQHYAPFLRSLPAPLPPRERTLLPRQWKFTFEAKETPKTEGIPPAPDWQGADFDDARWDDTTVPEWRYRVRQSDTAVGADRINAWQDQTLRTADTICWYRVKFPAAPPPSGRRLWLCFDGVDWEAQVYLNGELLGTHRVYYEPFRFDVTERIKPENTLAVRVIAGRSYGEPMTYWTLFPDIRAAQQRYVPNREQSIIGNLPIGYHAGCGFGIFGEVYLEQSGATAIGDIFVRNDLSDNAARVKIELNSNAARNVDLQVELLPENFEGTAYRKSATVEVPPGASVQTLDIPMPDARRWSPDEPYLYRCRVRIANQDARDVLFGCRSFTLAHRAPTGKANSPSTPKTNAADLPNGMLLLNGRPIYLRGTNIQGLNAYSYWGKTDRMLDALLLLKAGNFNAVRSCQHVELPAVREMMDRLGVMSEQDQGGGYLTSIDDGVRREPHIHTGTVLARVCYNNPGVVLICFGNEHQFDAVPIVRAALAVDPQRIIVPISGRFSHCKEPLIMSDDLWPNVIDDGHPYSGWYGRKQPQTWRCCETWNLDRMVLLGEFGAEAMDAYETMRDHYPPQMKPPAAASDTLWASAQIDKQGYRQIAGLGRKPTNLGEYIEASQNYQESLLADKVTGMRLSPRSVAGYFHFHFMDVVPAFWPKSIVSHDHRPKKAFYQLAQLNQPVLAVPQLAGAKPDAMALWVVNDLPEALPGCTLLWDVVCDGLEERSLNGEAKFDVPALNAVRGPEVNLRPLSANAKKIVIVLTLIDATGRTISRYQREVRCLPDELLKQFKIESTVDPFNTSRRIGIVE